MQRFALLSLLALGALGCPGDDGGAETDGAPPAPPASSTTVDPTTTGIDPTTTGITPAEICCEGEGDDMVCGCTDSAEFCLARRVIGEEPSADAFTCFAECLPTDAAGLRCSSDASCCEEEAECLDTGYCRVPFTGGSSSGGNSSSGSSSSGEGSSSSSSSSGEGSSSSSSSSGTDGMR